MARDNYDESKTKKKKKETPKPQPQKVTKSPSVTNVNNKAKSSTFLGGGAPVKKVEQKKTTTVSTQKSSPAPKKTTMTDAQYQKTYGQPKNTQKKTTKTTFTQKELSEKASNATERFNKRFGVTQKPEQTVKREPVKRTNSARLTAAQNQKMYGTTKPNLTVRTQESAEEKRKKREEQRKQAQIKKSGLAPEDQPTAAQKAATDRAIKNTPGLIKKAGLDAASGYGQTLTDVIARTASSERGTEAKAMKMGIEKGTKQYQELEEERKRTAEEARKDNQSLYQKMQQRQAEWDKKTKGAKGLEKAYYGAVESGTGMLADTAIGLLTGTGQVGALTSMGLRTYGSSANQARSEGATETEAAVYGLLQAGKEMGTEMIGGGGLAKMAYGKGALGLGDIAANTLIRNLKGQTADLANMGVRLLGDVAEENIEEFAGWALDPWIKELTYGKTARGKAAMQERSNALRAEIKNDDDARSAAAYISSDDFIEQTKQEYIAAGMKEKEAEEVAERMRDYLTASLTGDTDSMEKIEDEVAKKVAGSHNVWSDYSFRELKETFEATTLLVAATGLPGNISTMNRGNLVKEQLGAEGVNALANTAIDFEDSQMSTKAKAMKARIDSGKELTGTQVYELQVGMQEQVRKDTEREQSSRRMAARAIENDNLLTPYRENENGGIDLDETTEAAYREHANRAGQIIDAIADEKKESITDTQKIDGSKAIAGFQTGVFTVDDANALNYSNTAIRSAFETATGINLGQYVVTKRNGEVDIPATNTKTKDALFAMAADNLVKSAQAETANWMDNAKGQVVTQVSARMGAQGSAVLQQALDDVDERDRSKYMMTANATDMLYQAARNMGTEWESIAPEATRMFPGISESKLKMMYEAGLADREMANDKARGRQIRMGEALSEMGEQETATGKVFIDTEVPLKGSVIRTFTEISRNLGADIHFVDYIYDADSNPLEGANGSYDPNTNTFYLNVATGAETNIGYIFMHETTHYLKTYAPEQYQALENLVRERWFAYNPSQMQDAIARKIEAYKKATNGRQVLTEEQALEEIIADASHDFINDPEFAKQVAEENMGLAKAILDSIRNALRMLRRIFASGTIDDDTHMNSLFRELDILTEAEKLWLNAYKVAVRNNAIGSMDNWQNEIYTRNEPSLSVTTDEEALPKGGALPSSLKKWAKEVGLDTLTKQDIKAPVIVSVKDLRTAWYEKNGRSEEAETINKALESVGDTLTNLVGEYKYIDLGDALNATVHYRTDSEGRPTSVILSCQVKNAEYEVNFDFTTICAKRLAMQKVLEKFIKTEGESKGTLYDELKLDEEGMYKLRLILETAGFEVSCRGCFVEQNRYSQQSQARTIANDWNAALDAWAAENNTEVTENFDLVNMDINSLDYDEIERGFKRYHELMSGKSANVETKNRMLIESSPFFRKRMNSSDYASLAGQRALMAIGESKKGGTSLYGLLKRGQSDSKQSVPFTAYNGEVALLPDKMKGKDLYDYLLSIGGARAQSASDFQIEFLYDYMQLVADLSARGLPMHMYTKVIELAELFGMTGIKINLSAMCDVDPELTGEYAGLKLVDGKYEYNISDQSIDYPKAVELQKKEGYSKNIGIIMVALSSQHMLKSLDDPDVRYIIGYHSSAMPVVVANMSKMGDATDYTKLNKTSKLTDKGRALFDQAMQEAEGEGLTKYKNALRIFEEKIQEDVSTKKNKPRRGNEYGSYVTPYKGNTADFNTYEDIQKTNDARKTADNYIEWCMNNDYIPMYFPFAFHENYYKCEVYDFNMYDNVSGEYAPMHGVQNIYPGLNMVAGETDTTKFMNRVSEMMADRNAFNEVQSAMYEPVFEQAKQELKYSITGDDYMDFDASGIDHSELVHRADAPKTEVQMRDDAYMDAVNSGNMEEAQRLVEEAAKAAGYTTPKLYHGTPSFGFTTFDLDRGENIIFATSNPLTAETYSGETDRRNISDAPSINVDELYGESLLAEAAKHRGKYKFYQLMSPAEQEKRLHESRLDVKMFASAASTFIDEHRDAFDEEKLAIANRIVDSINRISNAWADDMVDSAWNDFEDAVWDLKWMDESIQMELTQELQNYGSLLFAKNRVSDFMYAGDIYRNKDYEADYVFDNQLALELDADIHKGIYELFGRGDNQLVIDANGSNWNQIVPPDELGLYGIQRTRSIAEAAKNKGYDSVLFRNLKDNGGETPYNGLSDVYMFFNPNQVKSADPVTYAEDGSVIPLSERFDPTNNDIRYSLPTQDSDGNILTDGQMEYFKNSQARDAEGRLLVLYHYSDALFESFDAGLLGTTSGDRYPNTAFGFFVTDDVEFSKQFGKNQYKLYANAKNIMIHPYGANFKYSPEECETITRRWFEVIDPEQFDYYEELREEDPSLTLYDYYMDMTLPGESPYEYADYEREVLEDLGFDAVEIVEGIREGTDIPTTSYALFNREQPKFVDNANPTDAPEMRFSISGDESTMTYAAENAKSTDDIWSNDPEIAEGRVRYSMSKEDFVNASNKKYDDMWKSAYRPETLDVSEKNIRKLIMAAMETSDTNARYRQNVVNRTISKAKIAYNYLHNGDPKKAAETLFDHSLYIIENLEFFVEDKDFIRWKELRTYLKNTPMTLAKEDRDADYPLFRQTNFGTILLVNEGGIDPTEAWDELHRIWPDVYTENIKNDPNAILKQTEYATKILKPLAQAYTSEECMDLASTIANDILDIIYQGDEWQPSELYNEKSSAMKQRHGEATRVVQRSIQNMRKQYTGKIKSIKQKNANKDAKKKYRQKHRQLYNKVFDEYKTLTNMLLNPSKERTKNIPEQLRQPLAEMLAVFDLEKERSKKLEEKYMIPTRTQINLRQFKDALEKVAKEEGAETEMDAYFNFIKGKIEAIADKMDKTNTHTIDALSNDDMNDIKDMLNGLIGAIKNWHQLEIDGESYQAQQKCDELGEGAIEHQKMYGKAKKYGGTMQFLNNIVNMGELTPIYFFRQIKGLYDMYRQLRKGFDSYVENEKVIIDKIANILSPYYKTNRKGKRTKGILSSGSTIEDWRHAESAETFDLTYGSITLTTAQKMSLYCLAKRDATKSHMFSDNGGIVASEITAGSLMHKASENFKGKTITAEHLSLTPADVAMIIDTLTEEQKDVADQLQQLMSKDMSDIGNETSMKLLSIKMYKEENYFPIKVQGDSRGTKLDQIGMREKVRNPGFSNPLKDNASNPIIIDDIFSVVASHCNEMNMYAAYAVPLTNFMKVYNGSVVNEKGMPVKVKELLRQTYGDKAIQYIENFLDDINGNSFKRNGGLDDVLDKALGQAKKAAVFANLRVLLQQPTAIVRALAVMNPKYFLAIFKPEKGVVEEMLEHCPIAQWKNWGYYDTHFGRDIEDVMMGNNTETFLSTIMSDLYGKADNVTWGGIWQMVKAEIEDTHPDVEKGSDEYWRLCSERASYVFDTTQVVDSPFHRSNDMRSKYGLVKQLTSFQAEPTLSFNVLRQVFVDAIEARKKGDKSKAGKILARGAIIWFAQAGLVALAQTAVDALRRKGHKDDDDDEDLALRWYQEWLKYFKKNWGNNFKEDINPINNVYYFKEIIPPIMDALAGEYVFDRQDLTFQWVDSLKTGIEQCKKKWEKGDEYKKTWYDCLSELAGGVGYGFGIPIKTMSRGLKNAAHWANKIAGVTVFADDGRVVDKAVDDFIDKFRSSSDDGGENGDGLLDFIVNKMGYQKSDNSSASTAENEDAGESGNVPTRESLPDNLSDEQKDEIIKSATKRAEKAKPAEEQQQLDYDTMLYNALKAASGLEGEEYNKKVYSSVANGLKGYIADGDYTSIGMMRTVIEQAGGDVDYFDKRVLEETKTAYKKTLSYDQTLEERNNMKAMYRYMMKHGMTQEQLSEDILYSSDLAKDMKVAYRLGDDNLIYEAMLPLVDAGITRTDLEKLYTNRNKMDLNKYKEYGRYKDKLKSMGTFIWPTDGQITSYFGYRNAPTRGASSNHPAIDIGAPMGSQVVAADGGVVISAGWNGGYGNSVGIKHDNGMVTYYNHLSAWNVKEGDTVAQGQPIANVGSTGISTGPHLDFKILDAKGEPVDPLKYLASRS